MTNPERTAMKVGTLARLVQPVIEGRIVERRINPATDELELLVEWTETDDGEPVRRWFDADVLEEVQS